MEARCQNCLEYSELIPIPEQHLDHDLKGRIKQGYEVTMCSKCQCPHFYKPNPNIGTLRYFTSELRFREYLSRNAQGLSFIPNVTMRKGQKWYSWMKDDAENKTLYWSILW